MSSHRARRTVALGWAALALAIAGATGEASCHPPDRTAARHTETASSTAGQRYPLTGTVLSVDVQRHRTVIDHKAIPGLMAAMTMADPVRDVGTLQRLVPGQHITAAVIVTADSLWLEHIVVLARKP